MYGAERKAGVSLAVQVVCLDGAWVLSTALRGGHRLG